MNSEKYFKDRKNPLASGEKSGFAERLKGLRNEYGLSKEALSVKLNLAKSTYGTYENDKFFPDPKTLRDMAEYFHTTTDYLLGLTDERDAVRTAKKKTRKRSSHAVSDDVSEVKRKRPTYRSIEINDTYREPVGPFTQKCMGMLADIRCDESIKTIFEDLVTNKEFEHFLKYAYIYAKYSSNIKKKEIQELKQQQLYDKIFFVVLDDRLLGEEGNIVNQVTKQDVFYGLMHKSLDVIIEDLSSSQYYIDELKKLIENVKSNG